MSNTLSDKVTKEECREALADDSEYVLLDPNITVVLFSDTLNITVESTGEKVEINKREVNVGRDVACDLKFENSYIARWHATFFYEKEKWFLRDNNSTNGIWLNGVRMKAGKKYQLAANDEINFASVEKVFFYKFNCPEEPVIKVLSETEEPMKAATEKQDGFINSIVDNRYQVLKQINQYGNSGTYLGLDLRLNKVWAMKVYDKVHGKVMPMFYERLVYDMKRIVGFEHPAIPRIVDIIEDEKNIIVIREYCDGTTLEEMVNLFGAQPVERVVEWGRQLCDFLGYLHKSVPAYIYRDMKPSNVVLTSTGRIKVVDYDIMIEYDPDAKDDVCLGTIGYAAPEQYCGYTDARTDIYALGMTLHQLVTGENPIYYHNISPVCQFKPDLPKGLEYIISKCTQPEPEKRYQNCDELMIDLCNYLNLPKSKGLLSKVFKKK